jgi:hypothetical protein
MQNERTSFIKINTKMKLFLYLIILYKMFKRSITKITKNMKKLFYKNANDEYDVYDDKNYHYTINNMSKFILVLPFSYNLKK